MKLSFHIFWLVVALAAQRANAEALIAPSFPGSAPWELASSLPQKSNDGSASAEVKNFYPATEDKANPKNIVSITSAHGLPSNIGTVEYLTLLAQGLQEKCESLRATRPTLLLERRTPVSYARLYCSRVKGNDFGVIQTIKVLQGRSNTFAVIREWHVPPFDFVLGPSVTEQFANRVFKSPDEASTWLQQMVSANDHLSNKVFICAEKQGDFGEPCATK